MKLIYVAGKYRSDTPIGVKFNIRVADMTGEVLCEKFPQLYPVIPHKNTEGYEGLQDDDYFIEGTKELMRRCDAVYLCYGWEQSEGSKGEKAEAERLGLPVFTNLTEVREWIESC